MPTKAKTVKKSTSKADQAVHITDTLRAYELTVVVSPVVKAEKRAGALASIQSVIESVKGKIEKTDEWGLKDLAYPIDHLQSGWYALLTIKLPAGTVSRVDQAMVRDKNLLRHLLVSK